jgi:hypothetical protein
MLHIQHSHIHVKRIVFDGNNACCKDGIHVHDAPPPATPLTGIVLEDNRIVNTNGATIIWGGNIDGFIYRWNYLQRTINAGSGEAFYMGSAGTSGPMSNGQIYANTIIDPTQECWDVKSGAMGNDIHHNICDGSGRLTTTGNSVHGTSNYGPITFAAAGPNHFHNNIIKNFKVRDNGGGGVMIFGASTTGNLVERNVFRNQLFGNQKLGGTGGAATVKANTFCSFLSNNISSNANYVLIDNKGAPGSASANSECDAEEHRILAEMRTLPGNPNEQLGTAPLASPSNLTIVPSM